MLPCSAMLCQLRQDVIQRSWFDSAFLVTIPSRSLHIFMHSARVRAVLESFETTTTDLNLAFLSHIYNSLAEHFHGGPVTLFNPFTPVIT